MFARQNPDAKEKKNFHGEYRKWVLTYYPSITEEQWEDILAADQSHDYQTYPTATSPHQDQDPPSDPPTDPPSESIDGPEDTSIPGVNPAAYEF